MPITLLPGQNHVDRCGTEPPLSTVRVFLLPGEYVVYRCEGDTEYTRVSCGTQLTRRVAYLELRARQRVVVHCSPGT